MIEKNKLIEYMDYFLKDFRSNSKLRVEKQVETDDILIYSILTSKKSYDFCGGLNVKIDPFTFSFFGDFIPDIYMEEDDHISTWETKTEKEIYESLDNYIAKYKYIIENGYMFEFFSGEINCAENCEIMNRDQIDKINYEAMYNENCGRLKTISYDQIDKISIYDFYGDEIKKYEPQKNIVKE